MDRKGRQRDAGAASAGDFWGFAIVAAWIVPAVALALPAHPAPDPPEQTLAAVHECMMRTPAPWPDAWQQEYVETIRQAIVPDPNTSEFARRLQILRDGFPLYWPAQKFTPERTHFEVRQAQIRWYVENLMDANLPGAEETARLRRQYEDLADYAAAGLLMQFSFLDPNMVQKAKADHLGNCYRHLDAPLLPIFLHPFSEVQAEQIKGCWHDQRYTRIDLWQELEADAKASVENPAGTPLQVHRDYLLTLRSLGLLGGGIGAIAAPPPDYFQSAVSNALEAQRRRFLAMSEVRRQEMRLSLSVVQTEYLSFLLAALLETSGFRPSTQER